MAEILPHIQRNPINEPTTPDWLIPTIHSIINTDVPPLRDSPFIFDMTPEAAYHNSLVFRQYNNKVTDVIEACENSIISYGSEFRPPSLLENLLMHHLRWTKFQSILSRGSIWPLAEITDDLRIQKNVELLERGNHQSALIHNDQLQSILSKKKSSKAGWYRYLPLTSNI